MLVALVARTVATVPPEALVGHNRTVVNSNSSARTSSWSEFALVLAQNYHASIAFFMALKVQVARKFIFWFKNPRDQKQENRDFLGPHFRRRTPKFLYIPSGFFY